MRMNWGGDGILNVLASQPSLSLTRQEERKAIRDYGYSVKINRTLGGWETALGRRSKDGALPQTFLLSEVLSVHHCLLYAFWRDDSSSDSIGRMITMPLLHSPMPSILISSSISPSSVRQVRSPPPISPTSWCLLRQATGRKAINESDSFYRFVQEQVRLSQVGRFEFRFRCLFDSLWLKKFHSNSKSSELIVFCCDLENGWVEIWSCLCLFDVVKSCVPSGRGRGEEILPHSVCAV